MARSGGAVLAVKVTAAGLAYLLHVLLARIMGPAAYGDYVYALACVSLLALFATGGLDAAALRFLAAYAGTERWSQARGLLRRATQLVGATSFLMTLVYLSGLLLVRRTIETDLAMVLTLAFPLLMISAFLALSGRVLQSLRRVVLAEAPDKILRPILLGVSVTSLYLLCPGSPSATEVVVLNWTMALVALVVMLTCIAKVLPNRIREADPVYRTREWISVGLPLLLLSGLNMVIARTDLLMIGAFMGTTHAGVYAVGARTAEFTGFGLMAVNTIAAPLIAEQYARGETRGLQRTVTLAARGSSAFALLSAILLVIGGPWILGFFGTAFRVAYVPLVVLIAGQVVSAFVGSVGYLMTMTGHEREVTLIVGGAALVNVLLNLLLIPRYGLIGAAFATSASLALWNIILAIQVRRRLHVVPFALGATSDKSEETR